MRTYGALAYLKDADNWVMTGVPPHVAIRLKQIFPRIPKTSTNPFRFDNTTAICADLCWFMDRYPMAMSDDDAGRVRGGKQSFETSQTEIERVLSGEYLPAALVGLREGQVVRPYQAQFGEVWIRSKRMVLGDDIGIGKSYSMAAFCLQPGTLPAAVVVQTHLQEQWRDKIETFTTLRAHKINSTKPYPLPPADVYLFKYSQLAGWVDVFSTGFFRTVGYDEVQELRTGMASQKGQGAHVLSLHAEYAAGFSATPIYGYGAEIWNIYRCLASDVLGDSMDFRREWTDNQGRVKDPDALGSALREQHAFLRRTKADVGQHVPPVNVVHEIIESDSDALKSIETLARQLAMRTVTGSFTERGQAGRELDMMVRQATGVGKARHVAAFCRLLLDAGNPIILAGWHREVYDIWLRELRVYKPVMYTGTESPKQKEESVRAFLAGETDLFIISLRSGAGLDGLQARCSTVVFGELDWSKKIHEQLIGRVDREGQENYPIMAIYLTCEDGSDPPILDVLALKESQSRGIVDPGKPFEAQHSDDSRIKALAQMYLGKRNHLKIVDDRQPHLAEVSP